MRIIFASFFLLSALTLQAQLGIQTSAVFNSGSSDFITGIGEIEAVEFDTGGELAINYWFRLPKQRVEFLPTVYFSSSEIQSIRRLNEYGAQLKVNVYPFDFLGDCDCPTFGKQGPQLQKGFFLQFSGGYAFYDVMASGGLNFDGGSGVTYGGGAGLDIGISNLITLTPIVGARFGTSPYLDITYTDVNGNNPVQGNSKLRTLHAGLQVSFRFDHKKY